MLVYHILEAMKEYAREKCAEQRKIFMEVYEKKSGNPSYVIEKSIKQADEVLDYTMSLSSGNSLDELQRHFVLLAMKEHSQSEPINQKLLEALNRILIISNYAPELNMNNYDESQVEQLNNSMIEVFNIANEALQQAEQLKQK
jgi:hypothetical protein